MRRFNQKDIERMEFQGVQESQDIIPMSDYRDEIHERMESGVATFGDPLPWSKTHGSFRFRPGEVTIWAGINGHGKSMVTSHVAASLAKSVPVCIASLEMPVPATAQRMIRQIAGNGNVPKPFVDKVLHWADNKVWIYDQLDTLPSEKIQAMAIYCAKELKLGHVFIDSLMKCGVGQEDYDKQARFVDSLCWIAKTYKTHIHIIHHVRKGDDESKPPNKFDLKGSGAIADMVDNIFIHWRNKPKEALVAKGEHVEKFNPDAILTCCKQRHGEWEGDINLWFHKDSQQFASNPDLRLEWFNVDQAKGAVNG